MGQPLKRAVYVGILYQIQLEGAEPLEVKRCALGVHDVRGLVQADNRAALLRGEFWERPKGRRSKACARLWYERKRADYPGDRLWFHDMDNARAIVTLDNSKTDLDGQYQAWLVGPDVSECSQPGEFLCG
jgi:hypothetical protein